MAKCANCVSESLYVYQVSPSYGIEYCQRHLPRSLYGLRDRGALTKPVVKPAKKAKVTETEPVVLEPEVTDADDAINS